MSADAFQSEYASVMDSMMRTAMAQTTKLVESMVNDLRAEISRVRTENELLRSACGRPDEQKNQGNHPAVHAGDTRLLSAAQAEDYRSVAEKHDRAVQCDLANMAELAPLQQHQHVTEKRTKYVLRPHKSVTDDDGNSQMTFTLVKHEHSDAVCSIDPMFVSSDPGENSAFADETQDLELYTVEEKPTLMLIQKFEETTATPIFEKEPSPPRSPIISIATVMSITEEEFDSVGRPNFSLQETSMVLASEAPNVPERPTLLPPCLFEHSYAQKKRGAPPRKRRRRKRLVPKKQRKNPRPKVSPIPSLSVSNSPHHLEVNVAGKRTTGRARALKQDEEEEEVTDHSSDPEDEQRVMVPLTLTQPIAEQPQSHTEAEDETQIKSNFVLVWDDPDSLDEAPHVNPIPEPLVHNAPVESTQETVPTADNLTYIDLTATSEDALLSDHFDLQSGIMLLATASEQQTQRDDLRSCQRQENAQTCGLFLGGEPEPPQEPEQEQVREAEGKRAREEAKRVREEEAKRVREEELVQKEAKRVREKEKQAREEQRVQEEAKRVREEVQRVQEKRVQEEAKRAREEETKRAREKERVREEAKRVREEAKRVREEAKREREEAKRAREEEAKRAREEEAERAREEEAERAREEEAERAREEEAERAREEEAERAREEEAERARVQEAERARVQEAERARVQEAERAREEEAERAREEEAERAREEEAERAREEEAERAREEEAERARVQEAEKLARAQEAEKLARAQEAEKLARAQEAEKLARVQEAEKLAQEEEARRVQEEEARRVQEEQKARRLREEAQQEEQAREQTIVELNSSQKAASDLCAVLQTSLPFAKMNLSPVVRLQRLKFLKASKKPFKVSMLFLRGLSVDAVENNQSRSKQTEHTSSTCILTQLKSSPCLVELGTVHRAEKASVSSSSSTRNQSTKNKQVDESPTPLSHPSDPSSEISQSQFLATLAVLPKHRDSEKSSRKDGADGRRPYVWSRMCKKSSTTTSLHHHKKKKDRTKEGGDGNKNTVKRRLSLENKDESEQVKAKEPVQIAAKKPVMVEDPTFFSELVAASGNRRFGRPSVNRARLDAVKKSPGHKTAQLSSTSPSCSATSKNDSSANSEWSIPCSPGRPKTNGKIRSPEQSVDVEEALQSKSCPSGSQEKYEQSPQRMASKSTNATPEKSLNDQESLHVRKSGASPGSKAALLDGIRRFLTKTPNENPESAASSAECPPVKKVKLVQTLISSRKSLSSISVARLRKLAKAKAKRRRQQFEKTGTVKTNGTWIPPTFEESEVVRLQEEELARKEAESSFPGVDLMSLLVKKEPITSPLQPLTVIGKHLLRNQCGECGCKFSCSAALEKHVSMHYLYRPFTCKLCGKCYPNSKAFKRHDRVHRNGRIHVCPQCGKGFVYRYGLAKHIRMVHSRIKPFVCQICNKSYATRQDVESHTRSHTGEKPFSCEFCEKRFIRRVQLNMHLRRHLGERRFWCPECNKGFMDMSNMKKHMLTHTGLKPHACPHCPKTYTQAVNMRKHVQSVHCF
ncbi:axoneme-associated protein mst101(2)-like isoform X2 [Gouania willdenowi]|uniref:axoneme-associated protein mst101(2)-like isoform X2 n=1 Tax=Gouania willdenowi TaxID=441366 RepID=UPI001054B993|nr:axoneme-associated protein mst101(2)-like isoform X2 [Gouania willdenowi]